MSSNISNDTPIFAVPEVNLVPVSGHLSQMAAIPPSRMFIINKSLKVYRERNPERPVFDASQGDGGASLPGVPRAILERAAELQIEHGTAYDLPFGTPAFRQAVIEQYWRIDPGLGIGPANVLGTSGGRDALVKAYQAMLALGHGREGDVIITTRVPWISYNWGPYSVGANVLYAPGKPEAGWSLTPDSIRESVRFAERSGRKAAGVIITSPDNPTGKTLSLEEQACLAQEALRSGVAFVLFDWMYHYVTDEQPADLNTFLRLFDAEDRKRLMFLDGLTKSLGASNIRCCHLIAAEEVIQFAAARASHTVMPSYFALAVAMAAYEMGYSEACRGIVEPTNTSRRLLEQYLQEQRVRFILGKGYYAFIEVSQWLERKGWADSEPLGQYLAEEHGVAVVPGVYFSPYGAQWIRFSYANAPEYTLGAAQRLMEGLYAL